MTDTGELLEVSGGISMEVLKTLEEANATAEGDDSVFYSEDEEIPQEVSICALGPVFGGTIEPVEPRSSPNSSPQIQDSGAGELCSYSLSPLGSGVMDTDCIYYSSAVQQEVEDIMESKINQISSSPSSSAAQVQALEADLSKPSEVPYTWSTRAQSAGLSVEKEKKQVKIPKKLHLEPPTPEKGSVETDESSVKNDDHRKEEEEEEEMEDQNREVKYGTVSYRRIRRGLTRQRIEEFEALMQL